MTEVTNSSQALGRHVIFTLGLICGRGRRGEDMYIFGQLPCERHPPVSQCQ